MDKIFVKVNEFSFSARDMDEVNEFLKKNPDYMITSVTPISQHMGGETHGRGYYGVVITVSNRK